MSLTNFKIWHFRGGVHPYDGKELSNQVPAQYAPLLEKYYVVLRQNIGKPPKLIVEKGQHVAKGQKIAEADGFVSAPLHAPTSGTVGDVADIPGANGPNVPAIEIIADGKDEWDTGLEPIKDWRQADITDLRHRIAEAGIVGMGGAAFPCHIKLTPPIEKIIDTLILNGAECEPYLTADHRLMLERTKAVLEGAAIAAKILNVERILLGIEDNKPDAIEALNKLADQYGVTIVPLPVRYPQGGEKQLIYALTGRCVMTGGLPMDVGCVVQNVGSCAAIYDAVAEGHPLIERYTTITGTPVVNPLTWIVRIGTPVREALGFAGGTKSHAAKLIMGGPMMGFAQMTLDVTVTKNTSGILLLSAKETGAYTSDPCIRCGRCVDNCPMHLQPGSISVMVESEHFHEAEHLNVMDCMECGVCAYVCPAKRPLVQHFRRAKSEIIAERQAAKAKAAMKHS